jgi:hypothetical protein
MDNTTARDKIRSKNFKEAEVKLLLELVEKHKSVVECKRTDLVSTREKEAAWHQIEQEFNNASGIYYRDFKILKSKYENQKKMTKRKYADAKRYTMGTGGGPSIKTPDISEVDIKINEIVGDLVLSGHGSKFDSDAIDSDLNQTEPENHDVGLDSSWDFHNMPVVFEKEVEEEELSKILGTPEKRRAEEPITTVPAVPSSTETETTDRHNPFTMRDLRRKTSSPLLSGTR